MHDVRDRIPGESCSPGKVNPKKLAKRPCSQVRQRIQAFRECLRHRQNIQDQCFGGVPDPKHADVLSEFDVDWTPASLSRQSIARPDTRWRSHERFIGASFRECDDAC
jgi:hypothetical protein